MAAGIASKRIIRTWADRTCGTGESFYQTEDGVIWKTVWSTPTKTGVTYGKVQGDRITPREEPKP